MKEHTSTLRYLRMAPRKVRLIGSAIQKLSVNEAEAHLLLMPQRAAKPILKLLRSAISGAKQKNLDVSRLVIKSVRVDQGPMLKRYSQRAMGRATPIQKKMSHVILILEEKEAGASSRFIIVKSKKIKLPSGEKKEKKPEREREHEEERKPAQKPSRAGFLKKMFSRKAGFAK